MLGSSCFYLPPNPSYVKPLSFSALAKHLLNSTSSPIRLVMIAVTSEKKSSLLNNARRSLRGLLRANIYKEETGISQRQKGSV